MRRTGPLLLGALVACGAAPGSGAAAEEGEPSVQRLVAFDHAPFSAILAAVVRDGRVDDAAVRTEHREALAGYLDRIAEFDPSLLPPRDRLALELNLYNATILAAASERLGRDPAWTAAKDDFAVFEEPLVRLGGRTISLNALVDEVIRREFDEPRIHAALNRMAVSSPPLSPRAYLPGDLDETLETNMRRFLNDEERNRVDRAEERLALSRIFDEYAADFGGRDRLAAYVDRSVEGDVGSFEVTFLEFDWSPNVVTAPAAPPSPAPEPERKEGRDRTDEGEDAR